MVMIKTMGFKWQQKTKKSLRELKNKKEGKVIFRFDFKEIVTKGI
jgi:hypothetical protein